jgi:hypothetical protein
MGNVDAAYDESMSTSPGKRVVDAVGILMTAASEEVVVSSLVVVVVVAIAWTMLLSLILLPIRNISAVIMRYAFILECLILDYGPSVSHQ